MRGVVLIRHADAVGQAATGSDFDRPLSDRGRNEAAYQGRWLVSREVIPDRVLCSPAMRTMETAAALGLPVTHEVPRIYEASVGELVQLLEAHADVQTLALIGHNPGISGLAGFLSGRRIHMRPGTIVGLRVAAELGQPPQPGSGVVRIYRHPSDKS